MKKNLEKFSTDYRLITGYVIAFLLLLTSYLISLYTNRELIKQIESINRTHKIISDLENMMSLAKDGETGVRGFMNTKDTAFLEPFYKSTPALVQLFKTIEGEVNYSDNRGFELDKIKELVNKKLKNIEFSIGYFTSHHYTMDSVMLTYVYDGKVLMDNLRFMVGNMQNNEKGRLEVKTKKLQGRYTALNVIIIVSVILSFVFIFFAVITFIKESKVKRHSEQRIAAYQKELNQRIDELDKANRELIVMRREEKFASVGRIARTIAHEVRNPLTNIDLALTQVKEAVDKDDEDMYFLFDIISRNSERINQLVKELLSTTSTAELSFNKISVNELMDESLGLAKDRVGLSKIRVIKNYTTATFYISVDIEKMKFVFLNIIINATEAMKEDGEAVLTLLTKAEKGKCVIEISDNGIGIEKHALEQLFEPYYTTKPRGTGLGLAHSNNIILSHKGSIDVESKPGTGTKFIIKFDLAS